MCHTLSNFVLLRQALRLAGLDCVFLERLCGRGQSAQVRYPDRVVN